MSNQIIALSQAITNRQVAMLATVVEAKGASPAKVGSQIVLLPDGKTVGTVGGGKLEASILEDAQRALNNGLPCLQHYRLAEEGQDAIGTLCGGEVTVFVQATFPHPN